MLLSELKSALGGRDGPLAILLADGSAIPESFHVTEVGQVDKTFIDCGGKVRSSRTALLQVWMGTDENHRLSSGKLSKILRISEKVIPSDDIPVEVEYEKGQLSQYPVESAAVSHGTVVLRLGSKHAACLAKDGCGKSTPGSIAIKVGGCC